MSEKIKVKISSNREGMWYKFDEEYFVEDIPGHSDLFLVTPGQGTLGIILKSDCQVVSEEEKKERFVVNDYMGVLYLFDTETEKRIVSANKHDGENAPGVQKTCSLLNSLHEEAQHWAKQYREIYPREEAALNRIAELEKKLREEIFQYQNLLEAEKRVSEEAQKEVASVKLNMGLLETDANHTKTLLHSCETALAERDANQPDNAIANTSINVVCGKCGNAMQVDIRGEGKEGAQ